ncbi:MAG: S9 family peptidase [Bacteroidia bacterium]|nr:S9 family peptidase [Bacteroidia bacterium]
MKKFSIYLFAALITQLVFAQQRLTPELLWQMGRVGSPVVSPDGKSILYEVKSYDVSTNKGTTIVYTMPSKGGAAMAVTTKEVNAFAARYRPDGQKITFLSTKDGETQLYEMNLDGSNITAVTNINGGIEGYKYSPTLSHLMYIAKVKLDRTVNEMYPDLPLVNARIIDGLYYRHWDEWSDFTYNHPFIVTYQNGKIGNDAIDILGEERYHAPEPPFGDDNEMSWSADGKKLAFSCKKLNGTPSAVSTNTDIFIYNIENKQTSNITELNSGYDREPQFSPDGKKIAWLRMKRAGYESDKNRLMVYYFNTKQELEVTKDFDYPTNSFAWANNGTQLYLIADYLGSKNIFSSNEKVKKSGAEYSEIKQITKGDNDYLSISLHITDKSFVLVGARQNMSSPTELYNISKKGEETQLTFVTQPVWSTVKVGKVEKRWITTSDEKQMLTWVIYPPDFDVRKRYPTLLYCQGGPQSMVSQFFSYRWNFQLMANNGYIVVAPNRRGVPGFGTEWNDAIMGDYSGQCMKDYLSAIDEVSKETYVAKDKRGAVGASFGGFSVYWLAGNHQKRFKTFISHCGMYNVESWYGTTEEMFFANNDNKGPYWQAPRSRNYDNSPHKFVQNWDSPILVIHNEKDFRVPLGQGQEAFTAAQLKGLQSRFLYFPDENHWVSKPQNSILWQRVFFEWLDYYLK